MKQPNKRQSHLRLYRVAAKHTQFQLAVSAGVPQSVVSRLEQTDIKLQPSWSTVARLSRALDVDPFDLFPVESAR